MNTLAELKRPDSTFQNLLSLRTAALAGVAGAIVTVVVADQPSAGLAIGCVSVAALYSVYPFLSLAWGTGRERLTEWAFVGVAALSIVLAVSVSAQWLALGWGLHGAWDLLHQRDRHVLGLRGIPPWYIRMCWIWDFLAAVGLVVFL